MSGIATAIVATAIVGGTASYIAADKSADAIESAAQTSSDTQLMIYNDQKKRWEPYETMGHEALPGLRGFEDKYPTPSFEDMVTKPMDAWQYESSPAYAAKKRLALEELGNQMNARGINTGGLGAVRAADVTRRLVSDDYDKERAYQRGSLIDLYKGRMSENTDRYSKILDQIKVGQGAAGELGRAGNVYAGEVGKNALVAGGAKADFYSGLGGLPSEIANTGLKAYDYGKKNGWWGSGSGVEAAGANAAAIAYNPSMAPDTGALYGL